MKAFHLKSIKLSNSFLLLLFSLCFLVLTTCGSTTNKTLKITKKDLSEVSLSIEIAKTNEQRSKGYMGRTNIPEGTGMLFVFETEQVLSFWMKNTPTALSIAYIDKSGTIKEIHDMAPYSLESVTSSYSCLYALEVPQGWFSKVGIQVGDKIHYTK